MASARKMGTHGKGASRRTYKSPLRASQREATRNTIAASAAALLRERPEELTVAAIAERAGVSVPTVNRHFPSRQALLEGVVAHLDQMGDAAPVRTDIDPATFFGPGLAAIVRDVFTRFASMGLLPSASGSAAIMELRSKVTIPRRRRLTDDAIARVLPALGEPHRTWLSDLVVVLLSSSMAHTFTSYLGLSGAESAKRVHWLLATLFTEARRMSEARAGGDATGRAPKRPGRSARKPKKPSKKKGDRA